jgi:hypothetical protein
MADKVEATSIKAAKPGELVEYGGIEYDVVNDGGALRAVEVFANQKTFNREGVTARKAELERELTVIDALLAKMDELGVA